MNTKISQNKVKYSLSVIMFATIALILFAVLPYKVEASFCCHADYLLITIKPEEPPGQAKQDDTSAPGNSENAPGQQKKDEDSSYDPEEEAAEATGIDDVLDIEDESDDGQEAPCGDEGEEAAEDAPGNSENAPGQQKKDEEHEEEPKEEITEEPEDVTEDEVTEEEKGKETAPGQEKKDSVDSGGNDNNSVDDEDEVTEEEDQPVEPEDDENKDSKDHPQKQHGIKEKIEEEIVTEKTEEQETESIFMVEEEAAPDVELGTAFNEAPTLCRPGNLIKGPNKETVYYCASDGKRYLFPHRKVFMSWYDNFDAVMTISPDVLYSIPLGGVITHHPGVKMIKTPNDVKTYAVAKGRTLRWVENEMVAEKLYGKDWNKNIDDVCPELLNEYTEGGSIGLEDVE